MATLDFEFTDEIPEAKALSDPEVRTKAKRRRRSTKNKDYAGKRDDGWSLYCAHPDHLPNLCEREQTAGNLDCQCPCHEERGYDRVSECDDEEVIIFSM